MKCIEEDGGWNPPYLAVPLALVEDAAFVPYSIPGYPFTFNCVKWTVQAAGAVAVIQFIPLR